MKERTSSFRGEEVFLKQEDAGLCTMVVDVELILLENCFIALRHRYR